MMAPVPNAHRPSRTNARVASLMLGALSFAAGEGGPLPTKILLARWGKNTAIEDGQTFFVGEQTVKQLAANQQRTGWDVVTGDYEHQSVQGHPNYKPDPREYWAHGHVEVVAGQGLYFVVDSYTPSGRANAANYPDVSGQFFLDPKTRQVIAVRSVALCQHGQVVDARFRQAMAACITASIDSQGRINPVPQYRADAGTESALSLARQLLDLGDDATPEDVAAGLQEMIRGRNAGAQTDDDLEPETETQPTMDKEVNDRLEKIEASIKDIGTKNDDRISKLLTTVECLTASQARDTHNREIEGILQLAASQGKKVPDSLKAKDDQGRYTVTAAIAKDMVEALPVTEPVRFLTPEQVAASSSGTRTSAGEGVEDAVMITLGLTKEKWDKPITGLRAGTESAADARKGVVDAGSAK